MRRGDIWTVADTGYAGKPRPCVIVQSDAFAALNSVTVCLLTTNPAEANLYRVDVAPSAENGLTAHSKLMTDKLMTVPRHKLRQQIGALEGVYLTKFARAAIIFLGLEPAR